jgi:hypothetical protein
MKAVVVYESIWGNTADVAKAIAEGIGPDAEAFSTDEIRPEVAAEADLIVAGAPVQGFSLPNARMRAGIMPDSEPRPALSAPTLRAWLEQLPGGDRRFAAFDTKIRWSPGSAASVIDSKMVEAGFKPIAKSQHFVVSGKFGPLKDGELERARTWGKALAEAATR